MSSMLGKEKLLTGKSSAGEGASSRVLKETVLRASWGKDARARKKSRSQKGHL